MKILFLNYTFPIPENGGSERTIFKLSSFFAARGISVSVGYFEGTHQGLSIFDEVLNLSDKSKSHIYLEEFLINHKISIVILFKKYCDRKILKIIKKNNVKLISSLRFAPNDAINKTISGLSRHDKKSILSPKFGLFYNLYLLMVRNISRVNIRRVYSYSDRYILASASAIQEFIRLNWINNPSKIAVIGNAVSFHEKANEQDIIGKSNVVLIVARMVEKSKRIFLALELWETLNNRLGKHTWELHLVGHGEDFDNYIKYAEDRKLPNVKFLGRRDPLPYYKYASIFLMTSSTEGLGNTIIEAQQMGCVPVCFSSFPAIFDIVSDNYNGVLIPEGDRERFVDAVILLMKDESERFRLARNAVISTDRFTMEAVGSKWVNLFKEIDSQA